MQYTAKPWDWHGSGWAEVMPETGHARPSLYRSGLFTRSDVLLCKQLIRTTMDYCHYQYNPHNTYKSYPYYFPEKHLVFRNGCTFKAHQLMFQASLCHYLAFWFLACCNHFRIHVTLFYHHKNEATHSPETSDLIDDPAGCNNPEGYHFWNIYPGSL